MTAITLEKRIQRIIIGSSTPASDLLNLVNSKMLTEEKASRLLKARSRFSKGVREDAKDEHDFQHHHDI